MQGRSDTGLSVWLEGGWRWWVAEGNSPRLRLSTVAPSFNHRVAVLQDTSHKGDPLRIRNVLQPTATNSHQPDRHMLSTCLAQRSTHSSNTVFSPAQGPDVSRQRATPVVASATHSCSGVR